jgi:hypothetical protein
MHFTFKTFLGTAGSSLSNLPVYREMARRPALEILVYAAVLLALPALVSGGMQVVALNRMTASITAALQGNLPALRIEKGKAQMEGETFVFEKENEFTPKQWKEQVGLISAVSPEMRADALGWIDGHFPEAEAKLKRSSAQAVLDSAPPGNQETGRLLQATGNAGSFIFLVDLKNETPRFPPGAWGFGLSADSYFFNFPIFNAPDRPMKRPLPADASLVVNDQTLERWRQLIVWQQAPIVLVMVYLFVVLGSAVFTLLGTLLARLTAALLQRPLPWRQAFAVAVFALTPAALLAVLAGFLPLSLGQILWAHVIIYGVYVALGAKHCCLLE